MMDEELTILRKFGNDCRRKTLMYAGKYRGNRGKTDQRGNTDQWDAEEKLNVPVILGSNCEVKLDRKSGSVDSAIMGTL